MPGHWAAAALAVVTAWCAPAGPAAAAVSEVLPEQIQLYQQSSLSAQPVASPPVSGYGNVEIIVDSSLYAGGEITDALNNYAVHVSMQGYSPTLTTQPFADASALRTYLIDRHTNAGLAGAVLVGDVPHASFEIDAHAGWGYESFPCDLYLQDLNGTWADADSDGLYDTHSGDVAPEVWVGRMLTGNLTGLHSGRTEAGMLNDYFGKNAAYRAKQLTLATDGLAYVDDDWQYFAASWANHLQSSVSGTVTRVSDPATTTAADYKNRLQDEYESVLLCAHSNPSLHTFETPTGSGGIVYNSQLEGVDPQAFFYNLFACSNARFTSDGYMAGEYVFGTDQGLLSVGSAKTGGMLEFDDFYGPIGLGETFGDAWLNWWNERALNGFSQYETDWHYGMVMIGDPLLVTQPFLPDLPVPGDANRDTLVNDIDLSLLLCSWQQSGRTWDDGDFNGDGIVNDADLSVLLSNWTGQSGPASAAVPEPITLAVLVAGAAVLRRRR
jgi:uncharacterized protein (TIGR03382 family)